jgi:hypothetical protein
MNRVSAKTTFAHLEFMQWSLRKYSTVVRDTDTGTTARVCGGRQSYSVFTYTYVLFATE